MPVFDGTTAAGLIQLHSITHAHATDDMIEAMLQAAPGDCPFPSLRFSGFAAFSPAHADLPERAARRGVNLVGLYGSSEIQALYGQNAYRRYERDGRGWRLVWLQAGAATPADLAEIGRAHV